MANFVPPEILQSNDPETVHKRMLSYLPDNIDRMEGGGAWDLTRPSADEASGLYDAITVAIQVMFPQYSHDQFVDYHAQSVGLERRAANAATGYVNVTGVAGTIIPVGFLFATPSIDGDPNLEFRVTQTTVIGSAATQVPVACTTAGAVGNVDTGAITLMVEPLQGIESIVNSTPLSGGTNEESDADLIERIYQRDSTGDQSYVGSDADYVRWASEISGVGTVIVLPEWEGAGTGTVKLIIIDSNGEPANEAILNAVYDHIMSPSDRLNRLAPMDAVLTVSAPEIVPIIIAATVTLDGEKTIQDVRTALASAIREYYPSAAEDGVVRLTRIARILSEIPGVIDYQNLTLNSGAGNVVIDSDQYPASDTFDGVVEA